MNKKVQISKSVYKIQTFQDFPFNSTLILCEVAGTSYLKFIYEIFETEAEDFSFSFLMIDNQRQLTRVSKLPQNN